MRIILLFFISFFAISCEQKNIYKINDKEKLANEVTKKVAIQLSKETGLYFCGSGGRAMNEIKMLALCFDYYKPLDIEQGREMLVLAGNRFVQGINEEKRIHQYLYNYPFKPENIKIIIYLRNPDGTTVSSGNFRVISMVEGKLRYDIKDPETGLLKTIYRETYEEALEKLEANTILRTTMETNEAS